MHPITDELYLTNADNAEKKKLLKRNKINGVLNLATELDLEIPRYFSFRRLMGNVFNGNNKNSRKSISGILNEASEVEYKKVPLVDGPNSLESLKEAVLTLEEMITQQRRVALCCWYGRSRSSLISIIYLCRNYDMTFREAYIHVAKNHLELGISDGMMNNVRKYYQQLLEA